MNDLDHLLRAASGDGEAVYRADSADARPAVVGTLLAVATSRTSSAAIPERAGNVWAGSVRRCGAGKMSRSDSRKRSGMRLDSVILDAQRAFRIQYPGGRERRSAYNGSAISGGSQTFGWQGAPEEAGRDILQARAPVAAEPRSCDGKDSRRSRVPMSRVLHGSVAEVLQAEPASDAHALPVRARVHAGEHPISSLLTGRKDLQGMRARQASASGRTEGRPVSASLREVA